MKPNAILGLLLGAVACGPGPDPGPDDVRQDADLIDNRGEGKENWWDALPRAAWQPFERVEQSQSWFEVYRIEPDLYAIYEPGQFEEVISYLILGSERALLFDTGLGIGDMREVVSELTDLEPIVINSHTHYDHVGGNYQFDDVRGTSTEYTRLNARGRDHEQVATFVGDGWIWKPTPSDFSRDAYRSRPFEVRAEVADGDVIDLGGRELEVLMTPGHAPDALCLVDRENRWLFTGDTFYPATLYAHLDGSDFHAYRETATRLAALADEVDHVMPAHNEPRVPAAGLVRMKDAFDAIASGEASYDESDGNREYRFDGFTVLTPDPLPVAR